MGGTGVATLVRSNVLCGPETAQHKPLGLGSSTLPHQPFSACPRGPRSLRRQWTTAKPTGDVGCNVLPFFLDLSLAFAPGMEFFDAVKSSVDSEVVFQATLQVPAHHALACRLNAYGTPFAAPDLQAAAHELRDEDLEFAACLATPPDLDEQLSVNFGRVMSLLEKNQGQGAGQVATRAAQPRADAGSSAGSVQQQIRSTPGTSQQAPKVLVSVDEAESTAAQLQRQNSAKKQPKLLDGYGKRALQALLGLGYLLTVLHEKSLGGRMEFSAALTAASIISPTTSDGHIKRRVSNGFGVLAGLRQLMRECPSLSPMSTPTHSAGQRHAAAAAAAFAAERKNSSGSSRSGMAGDTLSPRKVPQTAASFEAAWERVLHPPLNSSGGGSGNSSFNSRGGAARRASVSSHPGLQVQLSLLAPCRMLSSSMDGSSTPGSTPCTPLASLLQQQQSYGSFGAAATSTAAGGGMAASSPAPVRGSPLAKSSGGVLQGYWQPQQPQQRPREQGLEQQQEQEQEVLHTTHSMGRGSSMDALLDDAIEQLRRQEPSLTDLATMADAMEQSVFARAAATGASVADALADALPPCTPVRARPPLPPIAPQQQQQPQTPGAGVRSFYLSDQGPLTSPLGSAWQAASGDGKHFTPFGSPWVNIPAANAARESSSSGGVSVSNAPGTPTRMLLPVMSMRLTCQPAWQYSSSSDSDSKAGGSAAAAAAGADRSSSSSEAAGKVSDCRNGTAQQTYPDPQNDHGKPGAASASDATAAVQGPSLTLADFIAAAEAADKTGSQRRPAVQMHQPTKEELQQRQAAAGDAPECCDSALMGSCMSYNLPQGLWPTMSFSLVPVRLPPASPKSGFRNSGASCPA